MIILNGIEYVRVSEILSSYSNYSQIDPKVLERKKIIGTNVHNGIDEFLKGDFPILGKDEYKYFCSFRRWFDLIKPIYLLRECRYFDHNRKFTGQLDAVVTFPGENIPVLIDYKTTASANDIIWEMQGHLYWELLKVNGIDIGNRFLFLKLRKEGGNPGIHEYKFNQNTHQKCMDAIENYWEKRKKLDNIQMERYSP